MTDLKNTHKLENIDYIDLVLNPSVSVYKYNLLAYVVKLVSLLVCCSTVVINE